MIHFSNNLYCLAEHLAQIVFQNSKNPFDERIIIVPSDRYKRMLQEYFATHPQFSVAMGICIQTLPQYLFYLLRDLKIPSSDLLQMRLYAEAKKYLEDFSEQQRKTICRELGALFHRYGNCSQASLKAWLDKDEWQQKLWISMYGDSSWSNFSKACESIKKVDTVPYLFGFSSLPAPFAMLFKKVQAEMFLFSPCRLFWADLYRGEERLLLKNWGKWGMRFLNVLSTEEMESEEDYEEPDATHTLGAVQKSILDLEPLTLSEGMESTIRVFSARNRRQEVEELLEIMLKMLQDHEDLKPSDILVLSPDLPSYVPFIHAIFRKVEGILNYAISGINRKTVSSLAQGICLLFAVIEEKWDVVSILSLFSHPLFAKKRKWDESDLELIEQWFTKAKMTWGLDKVEFTLDRWLLGLCSLDPKKAPKPCPVIGWPDTDLFASVLQTIEDLKLDLCVSQEKPLKEWLELLLKWIEKHFAEEEETWLAEEIEQLIALCRGCDEPIYSWKDLKEICEGLFEKRTEGYQRHLLEAIHFDGLEEGTILPKKVIILLGLHDKAFPRAEKETSLDQMEPKLPSRTEIDRFLFLEALLKAEQQVIISFLNTCPDQGVKLSASLVIEELRDYLGEHLPIDVLPERSFEIEKDETYFSTSRYLQAKACTKKSSKNRFANEWHEIQALPLNLAIQDCEIEIADLKRLMKDPVGFFFKKNLSMPLEWKDESPFYEEDFFLKKFERKHLIEKSLKTSLEDAIEDHEKERKLPFGIFREALKEKLREEFEEIQRTFNDLRDVEIAPWKIAWDEKTTITLKGTIENISDQGLVELFKESPSKLSIWKRWPEILIVRGHPDLKSLPCQVFLAYAKKNALRSFAKIDADQEIRKLLYYYFLSSRRLSPLYPRWADDLFKGDPQSLEKKIQQDEGQSRYVEWLIRRDGLPRSDVLCKTWSPFLKETFSSMYEI